jgi:hypothetical protein
MLGDPLLAGAVTEQRAFVAAAATGRFGQCAAQQAASERAPRQ